VYFGYPQARENDVEQAVRAGQEHGFSFLRAAATIWRGLALAEIGNTADGIAQIEAGLAQYVATGAVQLFFLSLPCSPIQRGRQISGTGR